MFGRVLVWPDPLAGDRGAAAYARAWSERLGCSLELLPQHEPNGEKTEIAADDLCVFGRSLPQSLQTDLLHRSARQGTALLACPDEWRSLTRLLVLHEDGDADERFIRTAVRLGVSLGARPIVLTMARTERGALLRGRGIREALAREGLDCDFDQLAGVGVGPAALRVACWRQCQAVVVKRCSGRWWRPWRRGETLQELAAAPSSLAFLALPEGGLLEPAPASYRTKTRTPNLVRGF